MSVTIQQVRDFLRYDSVDDDEALTIMLNAAQGWVERHTGHVLAERVVTENVPVFRPTMDLIWQPYKADTLTIAYTDTAFVEQPFTAFAVYPAFGSQRVVASTSWPTGNGAVLTYMAGYDDVGKIPPSLIHAVCIYCALSDESRGEISEAGWKTLRNVLGDYWRPVLA